MTNPIHIMLDLETWGTEPGCDIRSIGACVFDPVAGWVADMEVATDEQQHPGTFYIACDNPEVDTFRQQVGPGEYIDTPHYGERYRLKYPLHRDPRTVQWWSEQSEAAQAAFADPVDLRVALRRLAQWMCGLVNGDIFYPVDEDSTGLDIRLWSHGAHFDGPILAAAYKAVGLPVPWHYRAPRDTRTAFDMAGITDHTAWLKQHPGPLGIPHHALDDAICQARAVCAAWAVTRRWYLTSHEGFESELNDIARAIQDEGDRTYFGSTNDADLLREIAECKDANEFERDLSDSEEY